MSTKKNKILILLLAGGLSRRFGGGIKTFAKINGVTIFEKIISNFKKQGVRILINSNFDHKIFFVLFIFDAKVSNKLLGKKGVSLGTLNIHSISNFFFLTHTIEV